MIYFDAPESRRAARQNPYGLPQSELERRHAIARAAKRGMIAPLHSFTTTGEKVRRGKVKRYMVNLLVSDEVAGSFAEARKIAMGVFSKQNIRLVDALNYEHTDQKMVEKAHLTTVALK